MFGEDTSESPRLPSPWQTLSRSAADSPSPLSISSPGTPEDGDKTQLRRQASYELLAAGLGAEYKHVSLCQDALSDLAYELDGMSKLGPEVDKKGHIEYKLKLPTPSSPHRLAKLITQLRWRLVEGGGQALYELGVLDSGTLVGLTRTEMEETLQTLGRMLAGLGGGEVKVSRVVRVGGGAGGKSISSENSSSSSDDDRTSSSPNTPSLFNTFTVDAVDPTCYVSMPNTATMTVPFRPTHPQPPSVNVAVHTTGPIPISRAPHPERPAEERAQLKRAKRDARRAKKQEENDWMPPVRHRSPPALHFSLKHPANDEEMTKSSRPHAPHAYPHTRRKHQPPEKVKKATKPTVVSPHKPRPAAAGEEARYVVEAVVTKRSRLAARDGNARRSSGESSSNDDRFAFAANSTSEEDEEGTSSTVEDEEDGDGDGVEGWSFLDFDSLPKLRRGSAGVDVDVDALAGLSLSL